MLKTLLRRTRRFLQAELMAELTAQRAAITAELTALRAEIQRRDTAAEAALLTIALNHAGAEESKSLRRPGPSRRRRAEEDNRRPFGPTAPDPH